jgi:hypothetical protein
LEVRRHDERLLRRLAKFGNIVWKGGVIVRCILMIMRLLKSGDILSYRGGFNEAFKFVKTPGICLIQPCLTSMGQLAEQV